MENIAIVIPVFRHSQLLIDAVESVLTSRAQSRRNSPIIIVNDGCPHDSTHFGALSLASVISEIYYVRKENSGLSAARNVGIAFVRQHLPDVTAIFFLDADNMISSHSIG